MARISLHHVYKLYPGNVTAVGDVHFDIQDREFVVLVGPSGCGKSTTLRMIAGLEQISQGTISIDGKVINDLPPRDRDIAMVFQNYALYPHMSVRENLAFGLKMRRLDRSEIDRRVQEAAQILELTELLDRKPKALSGGQRQRVALGRAIVRKPKLFLFDEPLSNLDAKLRSQMRAEIAKLHQRLETTMIYVTHDQVEAMTMGTKIVVMRDGFVQQIGPPLQIYNRPTNRFVAGFIGSPTMNFITGTTDGKRFTAGSVQVDLLVRADNLNVNGEVILGIRPEDLMWGKGSDDDGRMAATVELAEPMGAETYLHLLDGDQRLIARVKPYTDFKIGDTVHLHFNVANAHLFHPKTEEAVTW